MKKKLLALGLTIMTLGTSMFAYGVQTNAATISKNQVTLSQKKSIDNLKSKYDLKTLKSSQIPKGVTPIKFNTVEEAEKFIKEKKAEKPINEDLGNMNIQDQKNSSNATSMTNVVYHNSRYIGIAKMNIDIPVVLLWSSSLRANYFSSIGTPSSYLSGVYFGNAWTQSSSASNISNGGRTFTTTIRGKYDYYILINTSLTSFAGQSATYSCSYSNP
jgi:hypothetical protein